MIDVAVIAYLLVGLLCAQRLIPWDASPFFFRGPGRLRAGDPDRRSLNRVLATLSLCFLVVLLWPIYLCASRS